MEVCSRKKNSKRNIIYGLLNKTVMFTSFFVRTVIIQKLGTDYLGLGSLFTSILQVLNMSELGFSVAMAYHMYKPIAENDTGHVCRLLNFYKKIYRVIGFGILIVGFILMPFLKNLIKGDWPKDLNIYWIYFIFLFNASISYLFFAYKNALLNVAQRQDIVSKIDSVVCLTRNIVQILLLLTFSNYYYYIILSPIFTIISNILVHIVSARLYPQFICEGKLEKSEISEIVQQIKGIAIGRLGVISRNAFDSIVLAKFCGLLEVGIYSNYYYIFNNILVILTVITNSITASIGNSLVTTSKEKNYNDLIRFNFYFNWFGCWATICLLCLYQHFMMLWVGKKLITSMLNVVLFCVYFYLSQAGQVRAIYGAAAGIWWNFRYFQIGEIISNIILNLVLGYYWGMSGIIVATIITVTIFSMIGISKTIINKVFERSTKEFFVNNSMYFILTSITGYITFKACSFIVVENYFGLIYKLLICCFIPNIMFVCYTLVNKKHFEMLRKVKSYIK